MRSATIGIPNVVCHHSLSAFPLAAPVEESSSLRTIDSRACRGCLKDQPRTRQSIAHLLRSLPVGLHMLQSSHTSRSMSNGFAVFTDSSRSRLFHQPGSTTQLLLSCPSQNHHSYYELLCPCAPHWYSDPCGVRHLDFSLASERQVLTFRTRAWLSSRRLHARWRLAVSGHLPS